MNKLESIKERFNRWEKSTAFDSEEIYEAVVDNATDDIRYLLQRLERYETSLKVISEFKAGNALIHVQTLKQVAVEALKD